MKHPPQIIPGKISSGLVKAIMQITPHYSCTSQLKTRDSKENDDTNNYEIHLHTDESNGSGFADFPLSRNTWGLL